MTGECISGKEKTPETPLLSSTGPPPRYTAPASFERFSVFKRFRDAQLVPYQVSLVYFLTALTQELPTFAIGKILAVNFDLDPDQVYAYWAITFIPWSFKPVYGGLTDFVSFCGKRRQPYVIISLLLASLFYFCMYFLADGYLLLLLFGTLVVIAQVLAEVVLDSLVVELGNNLPSDSTDMITPLYNEHDTHITETTMQHSQDVKNNIVKIENIVQDFTHLQNESSSSSSSSSFSSSSSSAEAKHSINTYVSENSNNNNEKNDSTNNDKIYEQTNNQQKHEASALQQRQSAIQAECMTIRSMGGLAAGALGILLHRFLTPFQVVAVTACCPLLALPWAIRLPERKINQNRDPPQVLDRILSAFPQLCHCRSVFRNWVLLKGAGILLPILYLFIYGAMPTPDDAYVTYIYDTFSFPDWELAVQRFTGLVGAFLGSILFWSFCTKWRLNRVFVIGTIVAVLSGSTRIILATKSNESVFGMNDHWFIPADSFLVALLARVALMPTLVLAAQSCPQGLEATIFGIFGTSAHFASLVSAYISAQLSDSLGLTAESWENLWLLIVICSASQLIPLVFLPCLNLRHRVSSALAKTEEALDKGASLNDDYNAAAIAVANDGDDGDDGDDADDADDVAYHRMSSDNSDSVPENVIVIH